MPADDRAFEEERGRLHAGRVWRVFSLASGQPVYVGYEPGALSGAELFLLQYVLRAQPKRAGEGDSPLWEELIHDALRGQIEPFQGPVRIEDKWEDVTVPFAWPVFLIGLRGLGVRSRDLPGELRQTFASLEDASDLRPLIVIDPRLMLAIFPAAHADRERDEPPGEEIAHALIDGLVSESFVETRAIWSGALRSFPELLQTAKRMVAVLQAAEGFLDERRVLSVKGLGVSELLFAIRPQLRQAYADHVLPAGVLAALGTELEQTVTVFVQCDLNISETARQLYLHRNSLLYRIERIRELTGYDIRRFQDAVTVWSTLMLKRL